MGWRAIDKLDVIRCALTDTEAVQYNKFETLK